MTETKEKTTNPPNRPRTPSKRQAGAAPTDRTILIAVSVGVLIGLFLRR